jgi:hypothetical protein
MTTSASRIFLAASEEVVRLVDPVRLGRAVAFWKRYGIPPEAEEVHLVKYTLRP